MKKIIPSLCWFLVFSQTSFALDIDWSGQFWSEFNFIYDYTMNPGNNHGIPDSNRMNAGGYYITPSGSNTASFETLFLRLTPKVIVNDTITLHSEWWVGDPIFNIFGSNLPYPPNERQFMGNYVRGSLISARRIWGEFITDVGTIQVGRLPLHWGLGIVWDNGDALWSKYISTGDAVRWIAKFGSFSLIPSVIINSAGNTIAGSCTVNSGTCTPGTSSSAGVTDYSLAVKYENLEDQWEAGLNFIKRIAGSGQDPQAGVLIPTRTSQQPGPMNISIYDLYIKKTMHDFIFAAEVPIVEGTLANTTYDALGAAVEVTWQTTHALDLSLKLGYASGQPGSNSNDSLQKYQAFSFHPNYNVGLILFNYQLANFAGIQTQNNPNTPVSSLSSPYDYLISNTFYSTLSSKITFSEKWALNPGFVMAFASEVAGKTHYFYNTWSKNFVQTGTGVQKQSSFLGFEFDLDLAYQWDDHLQFHFTNGLFIPGEFYAFSNTTTLNATSPVFASTMKVGVNF